MTPIKRGLDGLWQWNHPSLLNYTGSHVKFVQSANSVVDVDVKPSRILQYLACISTVRVISAFCYFCSHLQ